MAADDHEGLPENTENTNPDHAATKPEVILRGGASLVRYRPVFSYDSKCVFVCCGHVIKVLSVASGECVRELCRHRNTVTSIHVNPHNHLQIFSTSLDKTIVQWDFTDGIAIKVYSLPFAIHRLLYSAYSTAWVALVAMPSQEYELVQLTLNKKKTDKVAWNGLMKQLEKADRKVAMGCQGRFAAAVQKRSLAIYSFKKKSEKRHLIEKGKHLTCVTCHPQEMCVATGCSDGMILLWWNFMKESKVVRTCLHWHSLTVETLAFTAEGSYLLSGGHECVLVKWQHNSQHRDFLPRLGAAVTHVSASDDNTLYAVCNKDNMIQIVTSNLSVTQCYQGLTQGHSRSSGKPAPCVPAGLHFDPRSSALITNGKPGHLQFYSVQKDKQLYNLDIVGQNYISPESLDKPLEVTQVEKVALHEGGRWLATVERRTDDLYAQEIALKFWLYNSENQRYVLNTNVDLPHDQKVNMLLFRPLVEGEGDMALTTSQDGQFKLWSVVDDTDIYRTFSCWQCESVGFYRDLPAGGASFSQDGSLLAVAFGRSLTLWDPDSNALRTTLSNNAALKQDIRHVEFGRHSCQHYLVVTSAERVDVWNMLTCSVTWSVDTDAVVLVTDPLSDVMAIFTTQHQLFVFRPSESRYIYSKKNVSQSKVAAAIFIPRQDKPTQEELQWLPWQQKSQLFFMNQDQSLLSIGLPEQPSNNVQPNMMSISENLPQTPFSLLLAQKKASGVTDNSVGLASPQQLQGVPATASVTQLLQTPAHVLPPISLLCSGYMDSLMIDRDRRKRRKRDSENSSSSDDDEEEEMDHSDSDEDEAVSKGDRRTVATTTQSATCKAVNLQDKLSVESTEQTMCQMLTTAQIRPELEKLSLQDFTWINQAMN